MIKNELESYYQKMLNSLEVNGLTMVWSPLKSKLIFEDKILNFIEEYNIKSQTIDELLSFVYEEDKIKMVKFFDKDLELSYKNEEEITQNYRIKCSNGKIFTFIFIGKVVQNKFNYYLIGTNYLFQISNNDNIGTIQENEYLRKTIIEKKMNLITGADIVTGLPNIYYFKDAVSRFLKNNVDEKVRSAMIMVDLDNFKYVNEFLGHEFGDLLLKEVSRNISKIISKEDLLSRYSGDTFLIFKPNIKNIQEVTNLCNILSESFNKPKIVDGKKIYITVSIGVALCPDHGIDYNTLLKDSDSAMHVAKSNGKNECSFFDDSISVELNRLCSLQKGLRTALEKNEFYVMFQPKISLGNSLVNGFEALARWESDEFGFVSPGEFVPIAENTKMIIPIGRFILEDVFRKIKHLLNEGYDNFKIAVNLSEMQLREDVVVSDFKNLIEEYKINPKYIEVEITESMLMKSFDKNLKILQEIKRLGISIALDDFGTGYSSLNYLTKLPIDVLKIDRSFVIDLVNNPKSKCIVENIINLSHQLGIAVVAEGVEEESQVEYLRTILCDIIQGYYFSKPRMFNEIKDMIGKEIL